MSSSVHFRFKSQKDLSRVTFDGTTIQVWDVKREIINIMKLGDGTDFELAIYDESSGREYNDDTEHIPRSSSITVRRLPPKDGPGKGGAWRYVSGKPPTHARPDSVSTAPQKRGKVLDINKAQTEEEKIAAVMSINNEQWRIKQQEMANETRIPIAGSKNFQKKLIVPEGEPPHGYICYRCGKKGHWIQACPTNDDPSFEGRGRLKRTTGIPRSMLKTLEQSEIDKMDEEQRQHVMLNSEGQFVLAQTDEKTWRKVQEAAKASAAAQEKVEVGNKELQERGLECPIDHVLFVDPMKTPCCGRTYCNQCISDALYDSDLTCPGCKTENIIVETLVPDNDVMENIKMYEAEMAAEKEKSQSPVPIPKENAESPKDTSLSDQFIKQKSPQISKAVNSKKRGADAVAKDKSKLATAPTMKRQKSGQQGDDAKQTDDKPAPLANNLPQSLPLSQMMPPDMSTMMNMPNMPNMPGMPNMGFPVPGMPMSMNMPGMAPFQMPGFMNGMNMNGMNMPFPNHPNDMSFPPFMPMAANPAVMMNGFATSQPNIYPNPQRLPMNGAASTNNTGMNMNMNMNASIPTGPKAQNQHHYPPGGPSSQFSNQRRYQGNEEDNAYMRQPVNPHRQNRQKKARPSDYREL